MWKKKKWFSRWALPPHIQLLFNHFHGHDFARENYHSSLWKKIRSFSSKDFRSLRQRDIIHMVLFCFALRDCDAPSRHVFHFVLTIFCFSTCVCQCLDNVCTLGGTLPKAGQLDLLQSWLSVSTPGDQPSDLKRGAWPSASSTTFKRDACSCSTATFLSPAPKGSEILTLLISQLSHTEKN